MTQVSQSLDPRAPVLFLAGGVVLALLAASDS